MNRTTRTEPGPARTKVNRIPRRAWGCAALAGFSLWITPLAVAAPPASSPGMAAAIARGKDIFMTDRFGGTRTWVPDMAFHSKPVTCDTCHTNAGTTTGALPSGRHLPSLIGAAADFPRYKPKKHQIFTLQRQLVHCIRAGLGGTPPAYNSPTMVDLEVYLTALSKGTPMGKHVTALPPRGH